MERRSDYPQPTGCSRSAPSSCGPKPSSFSKAAESCRGGFSKPVSSSDSRSGAPRQPTWSDAGEPRPISFRRPVSLKGLGDADRQTSSSTGGSMSKVRLLVGTHKGAFVMTSDERRKDWKVDGPHFAGWDVYHVNGSPSDPDRLYAAQPRG